MKTVCFYLPALFIASLLFAIGCANSDVKESVDTNPTETDSNDVDASCNEETAKESVLTECEPSETCSALPEGQDDDCIANFNLGTAQAGFRMGSYEHVGWYGYNDHTSTGTMTPKINNTGSEKAECIRSCDPTNYFALHVKGEGWTGWGAGIGLDWGETPNPFCDDAGLKCLEVFEADPNFLITTAEADERCQDANGDPDPNKMKCVMYSKKYKEVRDLSMYKGIGFWAMRGSEDFSEVIQVGFGIPETTRFLADSTVPEKYRITEAEGRTESMTYEGGCCDDDTSDTNKCYGDFATTINLGGEVGKWAYHEILFSSLSPLQWGMPLPQYPTFPAAKSIGIKFQTKEYVVFDYYIDDIHFIK